MTTLVAQHRRKPRVALVVSHPIQHFCPQYASIAASGLCDFKVFFANCLGVRPYHDKTFGKTITWSKLYLEQFEHEFLTTETIPNRKDFDAGLVGKALSSYHPNVVIGYGYGQAFQRAAKKWGKENKGVRYYYISDSEVHFPEGRIKKSLKALFLQQYFKTVDRVLTVGNANEFYYALHGVRANKMTRMNFPIDMVTFSSAWLRREELRREMRTRQQFAEGDFVLAIVGKLASFKRQFDAIEAATRARTSTPTRLMILGSGPEEARLKELASQLGAGVVSFAGFVPPEELPAFYACADLYVHCSDYDHHSLAISEATFMGLPVILSSSCGSYGPHDDVRPGSNGYVYPTGDVVELTRLIELLSSDRARLERFARSSRKYAVEAQKRAHGLFLEEALTADELL